VEPSDSEVESDSGMSTSHETSTITIMSPLANPFYSPSDLCRKRKKGASPASRGMLCYTAVLQNNC